MRHLLRSGTAAWALATALPSTASAQQVSTAPSGPAPFTSPGRPAPQAATAKPARLNAPAGRKDSTEEVVVTSSRRAQHIEEVPYAISVVSAKQLAQENVTDLQSLSAVVPGLSEFNYGARAAGSEAPNIRGINATGTPTRLLRTFEQNPVGTYIGNAPVDDSYFQLFDIDRVEILKGPQGTLYGAGSLGGAVRIIPTAPSTDRISGDVEVGTSVYAGAGSVGNRETGVLNIPITKTLAVRLGAFNDYDPGWINVYGIPTRTNDTISGIQVPANPSDPVNSSGIPHSRDDWNDTRSFTNRISALWKPIDDFSAEFTWLHTRTQGDGGPDVNPDFPGGAYPIDPNLTYPKGGKYQEFSETEQPFTRDSNLFTLDLTYDAGFATLSSTTSYHTTQGSTLVDYTYGLAGIDNGAYTPYYAGTPTNPRFIDDEVFKDNSGIVTEEVRLVSKPGPHKPFDYIVGVFYEGDSRNGSWQISDPGSPERAAAQGCLPGCAILVAPGDTTFDLNDHQSFRDVSVYGDLTWHFVPHAQATFGLRHLEQSFTDQQLYVDYTFPTLVPATSHDESASRTIFKFDTNYEYLRHQYIYALWSQGFRRGGANSEPSSGIFAESPLLQTYQPDSTNNFEAGFKGRVLHGITYAVDGFYILWDKPQIFGSLPSGNVGVYNAKSAISKGFEAEFSGPIPGPIPGLSFSASYTYAAAYLSSGFSLPANNGAGVIVPGLLSGQRGEQLPGSPRNSVQVSVSYDCEVAPEYELELNANAVYRNAEALEVAPVLGASSVQFTSDYKIANASATLRHRHWRVTAFLNNMFNKREILAPPAQENELNDLTNDYVVNPPLEGGVRIGYRF